MIIFYVSFAVLTLYKWGAVFAVREYCITFFIRLILAFYLFHDITYRELHSISVAALYENRSRLLDPILKIVLYKFHVTLDSKGYLSDRFAKYSSELYKGVPTCSFPFSVSGLPAGTQTLGALTRLAFRFSAER